MLNNIYGTIAVNTIIADPNPPTGNSRLSWECCIGFYQINILNLTQSNNFLTAANQNITTQTTTFLKDVFPASTGSVPKYNSWFPITQDET